MFKNLIKNSSQQMPKEKDLYSVGTYDSSQNPIIKK